MQQQSKKHDRPQGQIRASSGVRLVSLLDGWIFSDVLLTFLFVFAGFIAFVWIAGGPILATVRYIGMGISWRFIVEIAALNLLPILGYAIPISVLIAVIVTFVRLSENSEAVALFAAGISLYRMLLPTAAAAVVITVIGLAINNSVVPYAQGRLGYLKENVTHEMRPNAQPIGLPSVRDKDGNLQAIIWVEGGYDPQLDALRAVTITEYNVNTGEPVATVYAKTAKWAGGNNWTLSGVVALGPGSVADAVAGATRDIQMTPSELADMEVDPDTLNFAQLAHRIERLRRENAPEVHQDETNLWEKIALPLASLIFALVAVPLGLRPQRGGAGRTIAGAGGFLAIFAYYVLRQALEILAGDGKIDPFLAAFLPDVLGVVVAAILIWRAPT